MELYWIWGVVVVVGTWNWFESRGTPTFTVNESHNDDDDFHVMRFFDDEDEDSSSLDDRYDEISGFSHYED